MANLILGHYIDPTTKQMRQPIMVDPADVPPGVVTDKCPDGYYLPTWDDVTQVWFDGNPPPARSKAGAAKDRKAAIDQHANGLRAKITDGVSKAEMAGWYRKEREARAFQASAVATDAPSLDKEATARGITLAALVDLVIAKADQVGGLEAQIAGNAGKHSDAVDALNADAAATIAQIDAYDFTLGWPL